VIDWSSLEISSDLKNLYRGGELWERGDRGVEKVSTEIGNQGARNSGLELARLCSRSVVRSTGGGGRSTARSIGVHERAQEGSDRPPGRPTDKALVSVGPGRPWYGSVDQPVDRQARFDFPFGIRIPFLDEIESNLGFLKSRDFVVINKG